VAVHGRQLFVPHYKGYIENNGFISIHAANYTRITNKALYQWKIINDLGYAGKVLQATPVGLKDDTVSVNRELIKKNNSFIEYEFYTLTADSLKVHLFTLPTHPLNNNHSMRYAVAVDEGPITIVDFRTFGRSEEWKQNVLSNRAVRQIAWPLPEKGRHILRIYCIDPGVILDEIRIDAGGLIKAYSTVPETKVFYAK
jgi:hypothetical protein